MVDKKRGVNMEVEGIAIALVVGVVLFVLGVVGNFYYLSKRVERLEELPSNRDFLRQCKKCKK
jgi:flagellar basal body-associated protein FliL